MHSETGNQGTPKHVRLEHEREQKDKARAREEFRPSENHEFICNRRFSRSGGMSLGRGDSRLVTGDLLDELSELNPGYGDFVLTEEYVDVFGASVKIQNDRASSPNILETFTMAVWARKQDNYNEAVAIERKKALRIEANIETDRLLNKYADEIWEEIQAEMIPPTLSDKLVAYMQKLLQ